MHVSIYLSKPIEHTPPRVNTNVNYGLWVIMMRPCRFISCNKCTPLKKDVDNEGGYACVGRGDLWEISVPSSQFCCEPKTALKKIKSQKDCITVA